jgi:hypothetical protein
VADKTVKQSRRDEHGRKKVNRRIIRKKNDAYQVDCAVSGSSEGKLNTNIPRDRYSQ